MMPVSWFYLALYVLGAIAAVIATLRIVFAA